jgi:hypothetical protein
MRAGEAIRRSLMFFCISPDANEKKITWERKRCLVYIRVGERHSQNASGTRASQGNEPVQKQSFVLVKRLGKAGHLF